MDYFNIYVPDLDELIKCDTVNSDSAEQALAKFLKLDEYVFDQMYKKCSRLNAEYVVYAKASYSIKSPYYYRRKTRFLLKEIEKYEQRICELQNIIDAN